MASICWDDGTWSLLLALFSTVRLGETAIELFHWPKPIDAMGFPGFSGRLQGVRRCQREPTCRAMEGGRVREGLSDGSLGYPDGLKRKWPNLSGKICGG